MKLNWTLQHGCLVADVFMSIAWNTKYIIEQDEKGWGARACRSFDGMGRTDCSPKHQPLDEMIRWCEDDAECPPVCPPQPVAAQSVTSTATGGMSGSPLPSDDERPDVVGSGLDEAPPVVPGWMASFDARTWAKEFVRSAQANPQVLTEECMVGWFANALMRGYDEHRWKAEREAASGKVLGTQAPEPPCVEERLAELERTAKAAEDRNHLFHHAIEGRVFSLENPDGSSAGVSAVERHLLNQMREHHEWAAKQIAELTQLVAARTQALERRLQGHRELAIANDLDLVNRVMALEARP